MVKHCSLFIIHCSLAIALCAIAGCCRCESEPVVEQNRKLIVPPNFGARP